MIVKKMLLSFRVYHVYTYIYLPKYSEAFFEILRKNTHSFPEFVHKNFGLIGFRELHVTLGGCVWKKVEVTSSRKKNRSLI